MYRKSHLGSGFGWICKWRMYLGGQFAIDGYLSVYPLAFDDDLSVDVLVFPSAVCAWCGMSHPLPLCPKIPKTICSSDYGGGSSHPVVLFALLIVRILPATSGERGRSRYLAYLVPTFNLVFVARIFI